MIKREDFLDEHERINFLMSVITKSLRRQYGEKSIEKKYFSSDEREMGFFLEAKAPYIQGSNQDVGR